MRFVMAVALMLVAVPALAQKPAPISERMVGSWFGTGQPEDKSEMFIDTFNADGSFRNQHRWCRQGKATDLSETGRWNMAGNILTIDIATVSGRPEPRSDRYRVNVVDGKTQDYVYLSNNFRYKARKVAGNFPMPPCDLTS